VASGRGRDLRLLVFTAGLAGSAVAAWPLPVALGVVAGLSWWIIAVRMVRSWRASRLEWADVDVVVVDFDGTIADSMGPLTQLAVKVIHEELGLGVNDARSRYLASTGSDFGTQLWEIDPSGGPARTRAAHRFEVSKPDLLDGVEPFPDLRGFLDELRAAGVRCASAARPDGSWCASGSTVTASESTSQLSTGGHRGATRPRRCIRCSTGWDVRPTAASSSVTRAATVGWRPR
jgi:hypothetical protein